MKSLCGCTLLLSLLVMQQSARADFYTESLIYTGPPEFEEVYDYSETGPTYVSASAFGKDAEAHAEYWSAGGRLTNEWDDTYQGWIYVFSNIEKDFEVTQAGPATISFSWDGVLEASGSTAYDGEYFLYASAHLEDYTLPANADVDWYEELDGIGSLTVSEMTTFSYNFSPSDVGSIFSVGLVFDTMVSPVAASINMAPDDTLAFSSSFSNSLRIDNITGGIRAADNGPEIPEPATVFLLCSALSAVIGIRPRRC